MIETSVLFLAVPEAFLSHTTARSRSASILSMLLTVPYKSEENQIHPVLVLLGPGAPTGHTTGVT